MSIATYARTITDSEILAHAQYAAHAGDHAMATDCRRAALQGSQRARLRVAATLIGRRAYGV